MIPFTFPSQVSSVTGNHECKVFYLTSITGLMAWKDYIPVKQINFVSTGEGRTDTDAYQAVIPVSSTSGLIPFEDYVPVYEVPNATVSWSTDANGYIPVSSSGSSLSLNFAGASALDSRITFTRASGGTYFNSAGVLTLAGNNAARFDYDPVTLAPKGLLVEESRTNLLLQSGFAGAVSGSPGTAPTSWTLSPTGSPSLTVTNAQYGTALGDLALTFAGVATERHFLSQTINVTSGLQYAVSIWVEQVSGTPGAVITAVAGTATLTINQTVNNPTTPGRYTLLFTANSTGTITIRYGIGTTAGVADTVSLRISRPQVEVGAFATSYIPTTTASATRAADVATMTGTNFSSWYNQTQGTLFVEWMKIAPSTFQAVAVASDGTLSNILAVGHGSISGGNTSLRFDTIVGGVTQAQLTSISNSLSGTVYKTGATYKENDFSVVSNGGSAVTDTAGSIPAVNRLTLGANALASSGFLNGHIRSIRFYPTRLADATLQALTA